ncbi:UxaA family hydrolase [Altererythrobacter sp.]|uniref:UxaA family hydrolase n=1 Tax=Altererythrobacter sp. TaxID=1872480 RepID=UPI003CFCB18A
MTDIAQAIALHPADNVVICIAPVEAGMRVAFDGEEVIAASSIGIGHKLARRDLACGDKVLRHGIPIGTMVSPAARGEHVHRHNLRSDYIPSHERDVLRGGDTK